MSFQSRIAKSISSVGVATVLAVSGSTLQADELTIVSKVTPSRGKPSVTTTYLSPRGIRTSDGVTDSIMDVETGTLLVVEHKKKRYWETSKEQVEAQFAQLRQMIEANPMLKKMFPSGGQVQVERTGEKREIAGYASEQVILRLGEAYTFDLWVTDQLDAPLEYADARKALFAMQGPNAGFMSDLFDAMKEIGGVSLASRLTMRMMGMEIEVDTEATEVKVGPIPAGAFEPPAGYKQKKSPFE